MKRIVLASQSPRRHELLSMVGIDHEVITSDCDENIEYRDPADMVSKLSALKAGSVADELKNRGEKAIVIGSDTIVYFKDAVLGKPKDEKDAFRMLSELSGQTHSVFTGVTVIDTETNKAETFYEETKVEFYDVSDEEILNCMGIYHMCKLKEAKRMLAKYGGTAHTEWYDRDGSFQDSTDISLDRANKGSYRSA